jgi:hypothetical protein
MDALHLKRCQVSSLTNNTFFQHFKLGEFQKNGYVSFCVVDPDLSLFVGYRTHNNLEKNAYFLLALAS